MVSGGLVETKRPLVRRFSALAGNQFQGSRHSDLHQEPSGGYFPRVQEDIQMINRCLAVGFLVMAVFAMTLPAVAQTNSMPMRTPDGQPDISGTFTFRTLTPLQRPSVLGDNETLSEEEAAEFEQAERIRLNRDLFDPESGAPSAGYQPRAEGGVLSYNEFWYERGVELTSDKRTSLIVDPPNGRLPPQTPEAQQASREAQADRAAHRYDSYENRSLFDRCIMGFNAGPPMTSGAYNNNVQILQTPGYVTILNEMVHNARIIPLDGRDHVDLPQFSGSSRGHWEGDTLVIETTNFRGGQSRGSGPNMDLVERFTRIDPDTVAYEFTVIDETVYTRPWTAMMPLRRIDGPLYEYACHEGNIGMYGILAGARVQEAKGIPLRP